MVLCSLHVVVVNGNEALDGRWKSVGEGLVADGSFCFKNLLFSTRRQTPCLTKTRNICERHCTNARDQVSNHRPKKVSRGRGAQFMQMTRKSCNVVQKTTRNKCIATSNKCLTSSNKKLLETRMFELWLHMFFFPKQFTVAVLS